jgi:hypothetical protein
MYNCATSGFWIKQHKTAPSHDTSIPESVNGLLCYDVQDVSCVILSKVVLSTESQAAHLCMYYYSDRQTVRQPVSARNMDEADSGDFFFHDIFRNNRK